MADRKSVVQSRKRIAKVLQEEVWDCSVCTFTNSPEAFKCSMCDVRKGTSTRKPRLNQHIVAQQEATRLVAQMPQSPIPPAIVKEGQPKKDDGAQEGKLKPDKEPSAKVAKTSKIGLNTADTATPFTMAVTVNNVTVVFTELKKIRPNVEAVSR